MGDGHLRARAPAASARGAVRRSASWRGVAWRDGAGRGVADRERDVGVHAGLRPLIVHVLVKPLGGRPPLSRPLSRPRSAARRGLDRRGRARGVWFAPPPPFPRTNRTSLVPPLVLSGHLWTPGAADLRETPGCEWARVGETVRGTAGSGAGRLSEARSNVDESGRVDLPRGRRRTARRPPGT